MNPVSPERAAAVWASLEGMAARIGDAEVRAQYLADWRTKYEAAFPPWLRDGDPVCLPDWKHVGDISTRERRRARMVSDTWLDAVAIDGENHDAAKRFAFSVGLRVSAGLIDGRNCGEQVLVDRLGSDASSMGVLTAFRRGCEAGDLGEGLLAGVVLDLRCAGFPRTDKGVAQRFRARHGHNFRHTTAKGWLKWDGMRWKVLDEERGVVPAEILSAVFDTVDAIAREAKAVAATGLAEDSIPEGADLVKFKVEVAGLKVSLGELLIDADGLDGLVITPSTCRLTSEVLSRFALAAQSAGAMKVVADLARVWLTVRFQDFDTDPLTINCQNGTLRLIKHSEVVDGDTVVRCEAVLSPHDRADLLTKVAAVGFDPDATCPNYTATMEWAQEKPEMRRYLEQWGGYNLTGDMGAQIFHIWWGPLAQNGKSTILDAWADCAGDYAEAGKIESFMEAAQARGGDAATPALAKLPGVRMLRTGEPPSKAKFDESLINQITGQDTLQVRDLNRSFYSVKMHFKLTVACNQPPSIPDATEGIRRRIKVVPFEKTMKGALKPDGTPLRDEKFKEKLVAELPGIFATLVRGALDWLQHGFVEPADVTEWTEQYKDENDPLGRFLGYCIEIDPGSRIQASVFHKLFVAWSKATGGPDWSMPFLKKKMNAKGFSSKQSNGIQWLGMKAVRGERDFVDEHGNVIDLSAGDGGDLGSWRGASGPGARGASGGAAPSSGADGWIDPAADYDPFGPDWT